MGAPSKRSGGPAASSLRAAIEAGIAHHHAGRLAQAEAVYRRVLEQDPNHADALNLLGVLAHQSGRNEIAIDLIEKAIRANPAYPVFHWNLGSILAALKRDDEAMACFQKAVSIKPDYAEAHNGIGVMLGNRGRHEKAIASLRQALAIKPDYADAHNNLGKTLRDCRRHDEAIECLKKAVALNPDYAEAHHNLGNTYRDQGRHEEAIACYRRALAIRPDFALAHHALIFAMNQSAKDPADILAACRKYAEQVEKPGIRLALANDPDPDRRLKVGYVSGDFRQHSVAYFIEPLLANHDPHVVEVFCYANHHKVDDVTRRLMKHSAHWRPIVQLSDAQAARLIQRDGIDVLVDLSGHTNYNRLAVFAMKPAPVQVTWIGLPNTTGLTAMDYRLTSAYVDPPGATERYHTETLVRLAYYACFQPEAGLPPVNDLPALTNGYVTFASFNNTKKLSASVLAVWSRILQQIPDARLRVICHDVARQEIVEQFAAHGIGTERLVFVDRMSPAQYLFQHHHVDIGLDPFPYNGGTITRNSLWMGVPVVTLAGRTPVSRVGASLMSQVGLEDFIAGSEDDYVSIALRWARDVEGLARIRAALRERAEAAPFSNAEACTREVEAAYRQMWHTWCAQRKSAS